MTQSDSQEGQSSPDGMPSAKDVVIACFGYFSAAVACMLAGYATTGHGRFLPTASDFPQLFCLALLLIPIYWSHASCYDQFGVRSEYHRIAKVFGFFLPGLGIAIGWVVVCVILLGWNRSAAGFDFDAVSNAVARLVLAVAPHYLILVRRRLQWPDYPLGFRFRCFFPALATCLCAFVFGSSMPDQMTPMIVASVSTIVFWYIALTVERAWVLSVGGALVLLGMMLAVLRQPNSLATSEGIHSALAQCFFGVLVTLAMGVSEAWRVTSRVLAKVEYVGEKVFSQTDQDTYLGGTNMAVALSGPALLLMYINPAATGAYLPVITAFVLVEYLGWIVAKEHARAERWRWIAYVTGVSLPILIGLTVAYGSPPAEMKPTPPPDYLKLLTFIAPLVMLEAFGSGMEWRNGQYVRAPGFIEWLVHDRKAFHFKRPVKVVAITGIAAAVFCALTYAMTGIAENTPSARRFYVLCLLYLAITLICMLVVGLNYLRDKRMGAAAPSADAPPVPARKMPPEAGPNTPVNELRALISTGRPIPSGIAALLTFLVIIRAPEHDFIVAAQGAVVMFALVMLSFVANDVFDLEKDRGAGLDRPLANGTVSKHQAIWFGVVLLSLAFGFDPNANSSSTIVLITAAAALLYTLAARKMPVAKGVYTAALSCAPLAYGCQIVSGGVAVSLIASLFVFILGRECYLDAMHQDADIAVGMRTIPVIVGRERTKGIAKFLMIVGASMLLLQTQPGIGLPFAILAAVVAPYVLIRPNRSDLWRVDMVRISMVLGSIAVAGSVAYLR